MIQNVLVWFISNVWAMYAWLVGPELGAVLIAISISVVFAALMERGFRRKLNEGSEFHARVIEPDFIKIDKVGSLRCSEDSLDKYLDAIGDAVIKRGKNANQD